MSSARSRRGFRALATIAGLGLVATPLATMPAASAADAVTLTLLNINDFHGRIDQNTIAFAGTIEKERKAAGDGNTLFLSAGDNIGASLFASSSANDDPTLDVLNALELKASAVGNHEFDQGFDDLAGHVAGRAEFSYLGANVYKKGTTEPALPEYALFDAAGVTVGVIGAVTVETPTLVSPGGISTLDFGDPVEAVNRVAAQLSDGDEANGEADVLIAEYHEGATEGTPEGATLDEEVAAGGAFGEIVTETDAEVDAIFTGHTHKLYAWDAPIPGQAGRTRPVLQTGSYGENLGKITLTVDPSTGAVDTYTTENVRRLAATDTDGSGKVDPAEQKAFDDELIATYPRVAEVAQIAGDAIAAADEIGKEPVGSVTSDITTAFTGGEYVDGKYTKTATAKRDDRSSESSLGNLVADALLDTLKSTERGGAEIGIVNPGGLRAELFYAGAADSDTNKDGVITFAEANAVLPFVNNLWTLTLTGAELKQVLEEQWQPDGAGRPFLHLGLSENVSTTLDPTKPRGERVTSVRIDGQPLDPDKTYRIGTFSFLAQGGDNFTTFAEGTAVKDTGLIDRDAWMAYLKAHKPLSPSYQRRQTYAPGMPTFFHEAADYSFELQRLDLTSLGSPKNTTVTAELVPPSGEPLELGQFDVDATGTSKVEFSTPSTIAEGSTVRMLVDPAGTTITVPAFERVEGTLTATVAPAKVVVRKTEPRITISVAPAVEGTVVDGTVSVLDGGNEVAKALVTDGAATLRLPAFRTTGTKDLRVVYNGGTHVKPASQWITVTVVKATPRMRVDVAPDTLRVGRTKPRVVVQLTAPGQVVRGFVVVRSAGHTEVARLSRGEAQVRLPAYAERGRHRIRVKYLGSDLANKVVKTVRVRVGR